MTGWPSGMSAGLSFDANSLSGDRAPDGKQGQTGTADLKLFVGHLPTQPRLPQGAKGIFPLRLGVIKADIAGGPYREKPKHFYGIKMAEEINADCVISIPTRDFSVPDKGRFIAGLYCAITLAQQGAPLWVGCMGGVGRTGLLFGGLSKVMAGYQKAKKHRPIDWLSYVRSTYFGHAVETQGQQDFINQLDVSQIVDWVTALQPRRD